MRQLGEDRQKSGLFAGFLAILGGMEQIIGRSKELAILKEVLESPEPQFLAVYGRRRIGKTFLISEFFKNRGVYFEITGMKGGSTAEQLFQFAYEFSRQFQEGERIAPPRHWVQAFQLLHDAIEKNSQEKKIILFFDEVPWLASPRSRFLSALEHFWNRYLSRKKNVILVICGSSASWIIRNIINNKGGLYGRVTCKLCLLPFNLLEAENYLISRHIALERKQILDLYMAIGGVPKYLSYVPRGKSAAQIVNELCFSLQGGLVDEFNNLYRSLFDNAEHHVAIVKALAKASDGLTKEELLDAVKLPSGGSSTRIIEELVDASFLLYVPSFNKRKIGGVYRLIDEYSLFYLTWIEEHAKRGLDNREADFWIKKQQTPQGRTWSGLAFESLCFKHIEQVKRGLGIAGISTITSGWRYIPKPSSGQMGAQIDLVIDRADKCINLCEMKYTDAEFVIDKSYADRLQLKKQVFKERTETNKTLFTTLVTTYGIKKNPYALAIVDQQLTMNALFVES